MKIGLIVMFLIILSTSLISMVVNSTATMNNTELQNLYDACTGGDVVISAMYGWYQSDIRDDEEIGLLEILREYEPINLATSYLETAFEGIIESDTLKLRDSMNYLLDPTFMVNYELHYLDLSHLWSVEYASGDFGDCLSYGQLLLNVSCIVDL
ncbi:MAG TPA: hypothetical protein DHM37_02365, partial [Candidatus Cloacimonas sp.]|nr:hypothetical protein [Candidatus Cloacimonas sp.]